ncbi:uncharacterized protein LOC132628418 [Lycium barbarum]|uniref:uncharacterized protein LOC132628418 n=1 Tax=Lycium barbarum TaxID=112863 RepID=UPI00293E51D6|nr:uncharacterized protein LOC132628418 [Lycium barbarum]
MLAIVVPTPGGKYTISSAYSWSMGGGTQQPWWRAVWSIATVPKHRFIFWLVMHERLLTRVRLEKMGLCQDNFCGLCGRSPETINYLFFECAYSQMCLEMVLTWLKAPKCRLEVQGMWRRLVRGTQGKISRGLIWAILAAMIYHIWNARNDAVWNHKIIRPQLMVQQIQEESRIRALEMLKRRITCNDRKWIEQLYM